MPSLPYNSLQRKRIPLPSSFIILWFVLCVRDPSKTSVTDQPGTGDMEWPSFSVPDLYYKELSMDMPVGRGIKADECALWGDYLKDLRLTLGNYPFYIFIWNYFFIKRPILRSLYLWQQRNNVRILQKYATSACTCVHQVTKVKKPSSGDNIAYTKYRVHTLLLVRISNLHILCFYDFLQHNRMRKHGLKLVFHLLFVPIMVLFYLSGSMDETELQWREDYNSWKKDLEIWRTEFSSYDNDKNCL